MSHYPPYVDESWETIDMIPAPPFPLAVHHWNYDNTGRNQARHSVHDSPLFAMLKQRKDGAVRFVPSVMDRHGNVLPVEPGKSKKHITFVVTPAEGHLKKSESEIVERWKTDNPPGS